MCDDAVSQTILCHLKEKDEVALRGLARSFAFEACRPNPQLMEIFPLQRTDN